MIIKYLIIFSLFILYFNKIFAQSNFQDSLISSLKGCFTQNYGDDDNSKAIIEFYFFRYKYYKSFPLNSLFIIVISSALILTTNNIGSHGFDLRQIIYEIFGTAILITVEGVIYAVSNVLKCEVEHLISVLDEYHLTKKLTKKA